MADKNKKPPGMTLLFENRSFLTNMPDEDAGRLFKALYAFGENEEWPDFADEYSPLGMAFQAISKQIKHNNERYEKKCRQNAENAKCRKSSAKSEKANVNDCKQPQTNANDREQWQSNINTNIKESLNENKKENSLHNGSSSPLTGEKNDHSYDLSALVNHALHNTPKLK